MSRVWADVRVALGLDEPRPEQVRAKHAGGASRVPFALLVVTLVAGGLGLLLLLNTVSAANEVRRRDLAVRDESIAAQLQELRNEVAASAAPGNLAQVAAELGMVPAGNPAFLVVGPNGKVQVMGRPSTVTGVPQAGIPAKHPKTSASRSPSKTTSAKTTPAKSTSAKSTSTKSTSGKSTSSSRSPSPTGHGRRSSSAPARPSPTPAPTPTPTVTLPGGTR